MRFSEWMDGNGITAEEVVAQLAHAGIKTTKDMVYKVRANRRRFSPETCRAVVDISGGSVTIEEMLFPGDHPRKIA